MDIAKHEILFSTLRISKYINACGGDLNKGLLLYKYNIQASQALYPMLSVLEIALRNSIDRVLSHHFGDANWLLNNRAQFATHPDMVKKTRSGANVFDGYFSDKLTRAEDKLHFRNIPITHNKILSELTFGFWVKFFDSNSIKILKGAPLEAFKNKPSVKLALVYAHLNSLLNLRNRISHSEPICFNIVGDLCLQTVKGYEQNIRSALTWIDNDLELWTNKINFFIPIYNRICKV